MYVNIYFKIHNNPCFEGGGLNTAKPVIAFCETKQNSLQFPQ